MKRDRYVRLVAGSYLVAIFVALGSLLPKSFFHRGKGVAKTQSGSIGVVHIYGPIHTNASASAWGGPDADDAARFLHDLSEDDTVKAILLRINSPGGSVGAVQEIYTEILRCKSKGKKVVVSMGDVAASGGYYLASAADRIVAEPGTITGSIGVILEFGNLEGLFQKLGVRLEVVKSGPFKDIGSPARPLTPEERKILQASIDDAYAQFVDAVQQGRHMSAEKVHALADGRIYTGRQALQAGLVDELGNAEDALQTTLRLANLPPHPTLVSDNRKSLASLVRELSGRTSLAPLESLNNRAVGVSLEYLLR